jgi:hypothetical protein
MPNLLYRITDYAGTPVWTDITPADYTPDYPYALAPDSATPDRVVMVADNSGQRVYESLDEGDTWANLGATAGDYVSIRVSGALMALFGSDVIDFSEDTGTSFEDRRGDFEVSVSAVGTINGMWINL